jgi:hypothetical protein
VATVLGRAALPAPITLQTAPGAAHEWRLAKLSGEIVDVSKEGTRWRAEIAVGSVQVPIDGLAGSEIPSTALVEGRRATVTGIVRRAYPTASDRRFSVVPRSAADIQLGAPSTQPTIAPTGSTTTGSPSVGGAPSGSSRSGADATVDIDIADLAAHTGSTVRIGGLVVGIDTNGLSVDDGTEIGRVVLEGAAADYLALIDPGDAINAIGVVQGRPAGPVVVVHDPAGIVRVGDPAAGSNAVLPGDGGLQDTRPAGEARLATLADPLGVGLPGVAGIVSLAMVTIASVAVTLLRRHRLRRQIAARVAVRVASIVGTHTDRPAIPVSGG